MRRLLFVAIALAFCCEVYSQTVDRNLSSIDYITLYQKYLSGKNNTTCSMYPSCSKYGKMVFEDNPFCIAMVLTADRLTRCGHDMEYYPITIINESKFGVDFPMGRKIPDNTIVDFSPIPSYAISSSTNDQSLNFFYNLINEGEYQLALLEAKRLLSYSQYIDEPYIYANILKCYEGLGNFQKGYEAYGQFPAKIMSSYPVIYSAAHLCDLSGNYDMSIRLFEKSAEGYHSDMPFPQPFGELSILYTKQHEYEKAKESLAAKFSYDHNEFNYNSSIDIVKSLESTKQKSTAVARVLSIVPGCGYFYTKHPQSAITALIINSALAYSAYTSYGSKNYGVAAILSCLCVSFYIGNIVGAGNSAIQYNNHTNIDAVTKLRQINPYTY